MNIVLIKTDVIHPVDLYFNFLMMYYSFFFRSQQRRTQSKRSSSATINDESNDDKGEYKCSNQSAKKVVFTSIHLRFFFLLSFFLSFSSIDPLEIKNWNHLTQTKSFLTHLVTNVVNDVNIVTILLLYINLFCLHFFFFYFVSNSTTYSHFKVFILT
jgi:hypothetical protein